MGDSLPTAIKMEERNEVLRHGRSFLGQPRGIGVLSFMQLCNSFANYGMSAVLIYYLYTGAPSGLGFSKADAAQLISLYTGMIALTGIVGSYVCDRVLGCKKSLYVSRVFSLIGFTCLSLPLGVAGYAAAMACLAVGPMFGGRCQDALLGKFYDENDNRRDSAYTITYVISNIGAAAPILSGIIAASLGYHSAFMACAVLTLASLILYSLTYKPFFGTIGTLPDDPLPADKKRSFIFKLAIVLVVSIAALAILFVSGTLTIPSFANFVSTASIIIPIAYLTYIYRSRKTTKTEKRKLLALTPAFFCNAITLLIWTQTISILAIFYEEKVDRVIFGMEISAASFQSLPAILAIFIGSLLTILWTKLGKKQPIGTTKMGIGTVLWGLGAVIIAMLYILFPGNTKVNALWIVLFYFVLMLGEGFTCPVGYSITSVASPKAFITQMMTIWGMSMSTGAAFNTLAVNFYHKGSEVPFFLTIGGIVIACGVLLTIFGNKLGRIMGLGQESETEAR
ncbi:MAG: oligopeptide:H+ symporter [Enterococcaceae bacterium]|jgi:POT family proton-dependent oligopeptide transporter|nr:oligopeptide:H+ symporter [Enterococcaceae bacterium]MCI1918895.1 oligopeptide:H+ symporter [Enterococcaceae bacterium]